MQNKHELPIDMDCKMPRSRASGLLDILHLLQHSTRSESIHFHQIHAVVRDVDEGQMWMCHDLMRMGEILSWLLTWDWLVVGVFEDFLVESLAKFASKGIEAVGGS